MFLLLFFFFQAEDGIRDHCVTGVQTCALPISSRRVAVCRELTKVHEEVVRGSAAELAGRYADASPKGEVVLVVGPPEAGGAVDAVARLVDAGAKPRAAAGVVAELTGESANALYRALQDAPRS